MHYTLLGIDFDCYSSSIDVIIVAMNRFAYEVKKFEGSYEKMNQMFITQLHNQQFQYHMHPRGEGADFLPLTAVSYFVPATRYLNVPNPITQFEESLFNLF